MNCERCRSEEIRTYKDENTEEVIFECINCGFKASVLIRDIRANERHRYGNATVLHPVVPEGFISGLEEDFSDMSTTSFLLN